MTLDVCTNGRIIFSVTGDFSLDDIAVVSKSIIVQSSIDPGGFEELFQKSYRSSKTQAEAYDKAEAIHRGTFGRNKYSSFESFCIAKSQRLNKRHS